MSYPAISLATATVGCHRCPQKRLQTARQPPVYTNSSPDHRACNSLTPAAVLTPSIPVHRWIRAKKGTPSLEDPRSVVSSPSALTRFRRRVHATLRDNTGALLLETIVAVTVFTTVGITALVGLQSTQQARLRLERQANAENVIRNQMEYLVSVDYQNPTSTTPYLSITTTPSGYSVVVETEPFPEGSTDPDVEKITVRVSEGGSEILAVETVRINQ